MSTGNRQRNPLRGTMWLPDISLDEIDWEPLCSQFDPTPAERARMQSEILARVERHSASQ